VWIEEVLISFCESVLSLDDLVNHEKFICATSNVFLIALTLNVWNSRLLCVENAAIAGIPFWCGDLDSPEIGIVKGSCLSNITN
jgi:hypothetical protein